MQFKNIALTLVTLALANASPVVIKRDDTIATYDQCMTICADRNQGFAYFKVPVEKQQEVAANCLTCIMKTSGCTPSGSDSCRKVYDACAEEKNITM